MRVLIAGCGYVGSRLGERLAAEGHDVRGLKRDPSTLPDGIAPVAGDVTDPASLADLAGPLDAVVYAVAPSGRGAAGYRAAYVDGLRNVLDAVSAGSGPRTGARGGPRDGGGDRVGGPRVILVSSTGVYGQADGRWVDEETPPEPADAMAEAILEGESLALKRGRPGVVLRLGGIYGPGRTWTVSRVLSGDAPCMGPDVYGNRIHREDAAGGLLHLLLLADPDPLYLGVDGEAAPLREVYAWAAARAGVPDPCDGAVAPRTGGRRGTNKRCANRRLVESGYRFVHPTFRSGYEALIPAAGDG